jgi:hypothetical protein
MFESGQIHGLVVAFVVATFVGCRAQVRAKAGVSGSEAQTEADDRRWEAAEAPMSTAPEGTAEPRPAEPRKEAKVAAAVTAPAATASSQLSFLGVARDLSLSANAPRTEACRCLAVAYGTVSDPKWSWQAGAPHVDNHTIAIAISTDGVPCSAAAPVRRASIAGIERDGTDIIVTVENVGEGRPIMHGALAPSPGPNAAIVVRTRHGEGYPAVSHAGACRVVIK